MGMLAMLFMMRERKVNQKQVELLSYTDVVEMLCVFCCREATSGPGMCIAISRAGTENDGRP